VYPKLVPQRLLGETFKVGLAGAAFDVEEGTGELVLEGDEELAGEPLQEPNFDWHPLVQ